MDVAKKSMTPGAVLVLGFLAIIALGSILLWLPISHRPAVHISYIDCLFVSVSGVCVTGLTPVDIATSFNVFGRVILTILIQIGGLGFATFVLFLVALLGKRLSYGSMNLAKAAMNYDSDAGVVPLLKRVMAYAFSIELLGALLLFFPFYRRSGDVLSAIGMGLFHSISAFNNAGFDLNGGFSSLMSFQGNVYVNLVVSLLIILGGLGFFVLGDICRNFRWSKLSFHTRIVLSMTGILILFGTLMLKLGGIPILDAFFMSVSARTAGFATVPLESLSNSGSLIMVALMFIGASPGSTGGGVKTTTIFVIFIAMATVISGRKPTVFKRRVPQDSIMKALTVFVIEIVVIIIATFIVMMIEGDRFSTIDVLFEVVSAAATVGLSRSVTPMLHIASRLVIMVVMFIGRLGPLTIVTSFTRVKQGRLEFVEENVLIG